MSDTKTTESASAGHRQRLRERFLLNEEGSHSDEALLELLLTYAIPLKDVNPLAQSLLSEYGSLSSIFDADFHGLTHVSGIKESSAVLIKLVDYLRRTNNIEHTTEANDSDITQQKLPDTSESEVNEKIAPANRGSKSRTVKRYGTALFGKAVLSEAIDVLPKLPDTDSLDEIRSFLRDNLHFSAEQTRQRNANYIIKRMFSAGYADNPLRTFSKVYQNTQELREVCFYRFMVAESLEADIIESLIIPHIGVGSITRARIRELLKERYPESNSITDCCLAIVDALKAGGIANSDTKTVSFAYRDVPYASFAFILHSEYPEPGMYSIESLENIRFIKAMLWNPDRFSFILYELRNQGLISKISEIDGIRQFTTRYTLAEVTELICSRRN